MKIDGVELRRAAMPLKAPFRTSFGTETTKDVLFVKVVTSESAGWGECVAMSEPRYCSEYTDGAAEVLRKFLIPSLGELTDPDVHALSATMEQFAGHPMAKAALETAFLDAELRAAGTSMSSYLGAVVDRVPAGVSVGIKNSIDELLEEVGGFLEAGYLRIKLKIEPGWDIEPVRAVRERFGDDVLLQVDANTAYTLADARHLQRLDDFDLLLIEQPLPEEELRGHARLAEMMRTPVCLDESITSAKVTADALAIGACSVVNIKPGRVGGYLESRRIHDVCKANGIAVWCGGMLETGIGRAANVALAALPGFVLPGDTSASDRYFAEDITEPFVLDNGYVKVPEGPGIGVEPIPDLLEAITTSVEWIGMDRL
ncbi:o-succinylbenzoate synthase [Rhodococcus sp. WS1]|uniref:o-succinylbenzoate synthase n=4 Tax=Actinomycetes TaxID=1760 RepID=A0A8I0ZU91_RHOER|nr:MULTISPECIES: o-succinylbenzoate synthase [Rhodococcus]AGT90770.1 N-acetylamino acid racemase [Rhodococcus erythropolis CCM2595]MBH5145746.1 o-succinylbenzoate synthase [Rhodococcus erythropolis]MBS2991164.1 o-succinylbenzoate synthase [Rhodococcus erythropolis]MBT1256628.1 o-succinylbenzoate synthase [Rhodococcus erythropolis]MBY6388215.1 o-succinylbenzoate synthase [Rhodococcus erythropolis]